MCLRVAAVLDRCGEGERCPAWMLLEVSFRVCLLGDPPRGCCEPCWPRWPGCYRGLRWPVGNVVCCFYNNLELLEHSVPDHAGPAGRHIAVVGPVGLFRMLSSSDCHPAGPYVAVALLAQMFYSKFWNR